MYKFTKLRSYSDSPRICYCLHLHCIHKKAFHSLRSLKYFLSIMHICVKNGSKALGMYSKNTINYMWIPFMHVYMSRIFFCLLLCIFFRSELCYLRDETEHWKWKFYWLDEFVFKAHLWMETLTENCQNIQKKFKAIKWTS